MDCILTINDTYKSPLASLTSRDTLTLRPGGRIVVVSSHDTPLFLNFQDNKGKRLDNTEQIERIGVQCGLGTGSWRFTKAP